MKEYQVNLYGKTITIIQDTDGKFVTPEIIKEQNKFGSCLKPAFEPIIVARKPFKGSLVDNVLEYGAGGLNIGECRVGAEKRVQWSGKASNGNVYFEFPQNNAHFETVEGRFPANVILTYDETDFEEVCGGFPDTKSGSKLITNKEVNRKGLTSENPVFNTNNCGFKTNIKNDSISNYGDEGSASRYFYCAKASKKDRDEGLDIFEEKQTTDGCIRTNSETARKFGANSALRKNIHPTVKPVELMQYLVRLVTPKGGTVLDCFMGSGSTGKAVMFENRERNANYKFIGVEMTKDYLPICQTRIDYALNKYEYDFKKELEEHKEKGQQSIFDFIDF